ncbi:MAG: flagellar biosynthetic protein FliR [Pseudomonadota bacterium]
MTPADALPGAMFAGLAATMALLDDLVLLSVCILARVGGALALVPGLGARVMPARLRLVAAVMLTALVVPVMAPSLLDRVPATPAALGGAILAEAAAGLVIGLAFRALIFALQVTGTVAAQSITLVHLFGTPIEGAGEPSIATLLTMGGVALMLAAGLHVDLVAAIVQLYQVMPFALAPLSGDVAAFATTRAVGAFGLGLALAVPFVLVGFAYNLALGALSRAMPQLLVALVGVPLLVGLGLVTLWLILPEMMGRWLSIAGEVMGAPLSAPFGDGA